MVEDYNFNDAYKSRAHNVGRYNLKAEVESTDELRSGTKGESYKPTTVFWSEPYVQGTDLNRIGSVYDTNFKTLDDSYNSIQYIHSDGDRIQFFFEDRVGWSYNSRYVANDLGGSSRISSGATAPAVSDVTYYTYKGGISLNPESFVEFQGRKYFFDVRRGTVCRLSQDGVTEISIDFIDSFIKTVSDAMVTGVDKDIALGAIDPRWQEYVLNLKWTTTEQVPFGLVLGVDNYYGLDFSGLGSTPLQLTAQNDIDIPTIYFSQFVPGTELEFIGVQTGKNYSGTIIEIQNDTTVVVDIFKGGSEFPVYDTEVRVNVFHSITLAYSHKLRVWSSIFTYIPDYMGTAGMDLITFKNAQLYIHNSDNVNPMQWYGEESFAVIGMIGNTGNVAAKTWLTVGVETNDTYDVNDSYPWSTRTRGISTQTQASDLQKSDFTFQEGRVTAPFLKNIDTPNSASEFTARLEGEDLKGRYVYTQLQVDGITSQREVFSVLYRYNFSEYIPQ
jgi:hypothetical protein